MSFRRAKPLSSSQTLTGDTNEERKICGVKPWINGSYLVSTGNRDLDDLIGGGQGLGTALMIESDSFSNYGEYLLSYGMAQALSSGHKVLVLTDNPLSAEVVASTLPYNQNVGTSKVAVITAKSASGGEISVETEESTPKKEISDKIDAGNENSGLKIAWQYEKYVTKGREKEVEKVLLAGEYSTQYCCAFDLSRRLQPSIWQLNPPEVHSIEECDIEIECTQQLRHSTLEKHLASMRAAVVKFIAKHHHPRRIEFERDSSVNSVVSVCRIFIPQLASLAANYATTDENCRSIVQFVLGIKQLVRDIHATVAFTLDPKSCPFIILQRLKWTADTVLAIDSFSGKEQSVPYEFKEFCGLLTVTRVQQVGSISSFRPPGSKFGLKRDSRKLHIEPLHLPPEESRTGTAGTAAAVTTAARDGFAAETIPSISTPENKGRIELKMDTSTTALPAPTSSSKLGTPDAPTLSQSNLYSDVRTPSKYEDKGIYDKDDVGNGNIAARSIFARAREQGLLPGARGIESLSIAGSATKQRAPPLLPGSACAPNRPGSDKSTSLDF